MMYIRAKEIKRQRVRYLWKRLQKLHPEVWAVEFGDQYTGYKTYYFTTRESAQRYYDMLGNGNCEERKLLMDHFERHEV